MTGATDDQGAAASTVGRLEATGDGAAALKSTRPADAYCLHCGRRMSPGKWGKRRYCCNAHRTAAYKRRRRAAVEDTNDGQ